MQLIAEKDSSPKRLLSSGASVYSLVSSNKILYRKAVLSQGNRAMPQLFVAV